MKTNSTDRSVIILENGEEATVSVAVAARLEASDLIYLCPDCGVDIYHVDPSVGDTLDDLEKRCDLLSLPNPFAVI